MVERRTCMRGRSTSLLSSQCFAAVALAGEADLAKASASLRAGAAVIKVSAQVRTGQFPAEPRTRAPGGLRRDDVAARAFMPAPARPNSPQKLRHTPSLSAKS